MISHGFLYLVLAVARQIVDANALSQSGSHEKGTGDAEASIGPDQGTTSRMMRSHVAEHSGAPSLLAAAVSLSFSGQVSHASARSVSLLSSATLNAECKLSEWQPWSACIASCGANMMQQRQRFILKEASGNYPACSNVLGMTLEQISCQQVPCPVNCQWEPWEAWSSCSTSECPKQTQTRNITIGTPLAGGLPCDPEAGVQTRSCTDSNCVDCVWGPWSAFGACRVSCGGGSKYSTRQIATAAQQEGASCSGPHTMGLVCNTQPCPVDCQWNSWTDWEACSAACNSSGLKWRSRTQSHSQLGGAPCPGFTAESQSCHTSTPCPVDCSYHSWSLWGPCSLTCSGGIRSRNRTVIPPTNGGLSCPVRSGDTSQTGVCFLRPCAQDCMFSAWSPWSQCPGGAGQQASRTKSVINQSAYEGAQCPSPANLSQHYSCPGR